MSYAMHLSTFLLFLWVSESLCYDRLDSLLQDSLLQEVVGRLEGPENDLMANFDDYGFSSSNLPKQQPDQKVFPSRSFEARRDAILGREPSIRDQEYLEHSSLFGHQSMQGGAGEGYQRLKPDGSQKNVQVVKTDALPAYCNPPNPCPQGYIADDGCLVEFENTAAFSREYQSAQDCMCDSEHMFDCPGNTRENEIDALARSFENEGIGESALDRVFQDMQVRDGHKIVAKKFSGHKPKNPFLDGEKLPVVAKKAPVAAM